MKKALLAFCVVAASLGTAFGQGRVIFNNLTSGNLVSVGSPSAGGAEGTTGQNVGSVYSAELFWAPQASYGSLSALMTASLGNSTTSFFGANGGGPLVDGAGEFDGGTVAMPVGNYTMTVVAWYNGGTFASYSASALGGNNVGNSGFFNLAATASPTPAGVTTFAPFTVQAVPEPGTLALLGLGAGALALIRRRKA